jgi:hypothetical protein
MYLADQILAGFQKEISSRFALKRLHERANAKENEVVF